MLGWLSSLAVFLCMYACSHRYMFPYVPVVKIMFPSIPTSFIIYFFFRVCACRTFVWECGIGGSSGISSSQLHTELYFCCCVHQVSWLVSFSSFHFALGALGLESATALGFMWAPGTQTQALTRVYQTLYLLIQQSSLYAVFFCILKCAAHWLVVFSHPKFCFYLSDLS